AMSWYQFDTDLDEALKQFEIVANRYPDSPLADDARARAREIRTLGPGHPAPDFEATAIDGTRIRLTSLKGRIVLVGFSATRCVQCMIELPNLKHAYERYGGQAFTIVGVSADTDRPALARFMAYEQMKWPSILAAAGGEGPADPIFRAYGVRSLPMSYL